MQWYGVNWYGPVTSDGPEQVIVAEVVNPLPPYMYEVLERENNHNCIDMVNLGHMYTVVRSFVHTFSVDT